MQKEDCFPVLCANKPHPTTCNWRFFLKARNSSTACINFAIHAFHNVYISPRHKIFILTILGIALSFSLCKHTCQSEVSFLACGTSNTHNGAPKHTVPKTQTSRSITYTSLCTNHALLTQTDWQQIYINFLFHHISAMWSACTAFCCTQ